MIKDLRLLVLCSLAKAIFQPENHTQSGQRYSAVFSPELSVDVSEAMQEETRSDQDGFIDLLSRNHLY